MPEWGQSEGEPVVALNGEYMVVFAGGFYRANTKGSNCLLFK